MLVTRSFAFAWGDLDPIWLPQVLTFSPLPCAYWRKGPPARKGKDCYYAYFGSLANDLVLIDLILPNVLGAGGGHITCHYSGSDRPAATPELLLFFLGDFAPLDADCVPP